MKLSDLPEGTVVEFPEEGYYEKSNTHWMHMYGHCPDCDADGVFKHAEAEEKFGDNFAIVSMPYKVVEYILKNYTTETGVLEEAIREIRKHDS